jgi:hypothetical protein
MPDFALSHETHPPPYRQQIRTVSHHHSNLSVFINQKTSQKCSQLSCPIFFKHEIKNEKYQSEYFQEYFSSNLMIQTTRKSQISDFKFQIRQSQIIEWFLCFVKNLMKENSVLDSS